MAAGFLKSRQTKYTAYVTAYILVILAVLAAVNFLANRYTKSYDSTSNKQFSLSDQTIKFVGNLKNDIKLTYFDEATRFPQARDLLDRYTALSPKIKVEFIDPVKKPQQAKSAGYRRDVTILVDSGARKEEAKSLTEEEVTGAIIRSHRICERADFRARGGKRRARRGQTKRLSPRLRHASERPSPPGGQEEHVRSRRCWKRHAERGGLVFAARKPVLHRSRPHRRTRRTIRRPP